MVLTFLISLIQTVNDKFAHIDIILSFLLQVLDQELKNLETPVAKELDFVKLIVSEQPPHVPAQLLRALEKDAKNLEKSLNSIREISESRLKQLHSVLELEKVSIRTRTSIRTSAMFYDLLKNCLLCCLL